MRISLDLWQGTKYLSYLKNLKDRNLKEPPPSENICVLFIFDIKEEGMSESERKNE